MKHQKNRVTLLQEFKDAPCETLFTQEMVAVVRNCSLSTTERDRWAGTGVPFIKIGKRAVRYRKADILKWLEQQEAVTSWKVVKKIAR